MRVPCLWSCGELVARGAMAEHQGSCAGAWLRCPGPGCGERMRRRYAGEHWARCPAMPDVCPECKVLVLRGEMRTHLDEQCEVARRLRKFTCPICLTEEDVDGAFTPDCDAHRFCFECVVGHVRSKVNAMSATSDERVTCPLCPVELSPHQVGGLQRPRPGSDGQPFQLEAEINEKYASILMFQQMSLQPGFRSCPRKCGYGIDFGTQKPEFLRCYTCTDRSQGPGALIFCLAEGCGEPHDPRRVSCAEYRRQRQENGC